MQTTEEYSALAMTVLVPAMEDSLAPAVADHQVTPPVAVDLPLGMAQVDLEAVYITKVDRRAPILHRVDIMALVELDQGLIKEDLAALDQDHIKEDQVALDQDPIKEDQVALDQDPIKEDQVALDQDPIKEVQVALDPDITKEVHMAQVLALPLAPVDPTTIAVVPVVPEQGCTKEAHMALARAEQARVVTKADPQEDLLQSSVPEGPRTTSTVDDRTPLAPTGPPEGRPILVPTSRTTAHGTGTPPGGARSTTTTTSNSCTLWSQRLGHSRCF